VTPANVQLLRIGLNRGRVRSAHFAAAIQAIYNRQIDTVFKIVKRDYAFGMVTA
jgi:hypothetical protein